MNDEKLLEMRKMLKKDLDRERYEHTKGVMYTAACLAMAHGGSIKKAMLAGLLHDCAKCLPTEEKVRLCKSHHIPVSKIERESPGLLHAKAGMALAREKYHIKDSEILHAIAVHTTGAPDMSKLDKIIYIADYIEPGRDQAPRLDEIRKLAFSDMNVCVAEILHDVLKYLGTRKGAIDPATKHTYDYYKRYRKKKTVEKKTAEKKTAEKNQAKNA